MPAMIRPKRIEANSLNRKEQVVSINRVTNVVKGGKNLSFSALVVIGDPGAKIVGFGTGKAKEVPAAIKKGIEAAKKNLRKINVLETTILHPVLGRFGSGLVLLKPAPAGTGVISPEAWKTPTLRGSGVWWLRSRTCCGLSSSRGIS